MADSDDDSGSADLSLKLRRGSSDSRDSFYMEFDQGIDSDIEAVEAAARTAAAAAAAAAAAGVASGGGQQPTSGGGGEDDLPPPPPPPPAPGGDDEEMLPPPPPMEVTMAERPFPSGVHVLQEEDEEEEEEEQEPVDLVGVGGSVISVELPDVMEVEEEEEEAEGSRTTVIMGEDQEGNVVLSLALGEPREVLDDRQGRPIAEVIVAKDGDETDDDRAEFEVEGILDVEESTEDGVEDVSIAVEVSEILKDDSEREIDEEIVLPPVIVDVGNIPDDIVLDLREDLPFSPELVADRMLEDEESFKVLVPEGDAEIQVIGDVPCEPTLDQVLKSPTNELEEVVSPLEEVQRAESPIREAYSPPRIVQSILKEGVLPERKIQSPEARVMSPAREVYSPKGVQSPPREILSPPREVQSPPREVQSPPREVQSPPIEVQSPPREVQSPPREVQSPQKDIHSPKARIQSPDREIVSPKGVQSPPRQVQSPQQEVQSPQREIQSPEARVQSPPGEITSPQKEVRSPQKEVKIPQRVVHSPREIQSPQIDVQSPQKDVHSPLKDVHSPQREIHSPPRGVRSPMKEAHSPVKDLKSPVKDTHRVRSPLREMQVVQGALDEMQSMLKDMHRVQSPTEEPRDRVSRVQSPPKEVERVKGPLIGVQRPYEEVQKVRSTPKDVHKVQSPVEEKRKEVAEEVAPGPSGSAQALPQSQRMPSPASSSTTTTASSDSASTPRRQRPGWDGGLASTDTDVAVAAAAATVALTTTGSPGSAPLLLPSPASPSAILVSPETLSPSRSTPTVDLKSMQSVGGHQLGGGPSAPHRDQQPQQQIPNGAGLPRQAPVSLGIAPTQTGLMLYHPQMAPVAVQHHPHHVHHHPHHHNHHSLHHSPGQHHHVMPPAIKAAPDSPPAPPHQPPAVQGPPPAPPVAAAVEAAPHPLPLPSHLHHQYPLQSVHPTPSRPPVSPTPPIPTPIAARIEAEPDNWRKLGTDALTAALSALYGKLLVVMGIAFPMAEVISTYIPPSFYEGFYLYLYIGSMFFLFYMYAMLLRDRAAYSVMSSFKRARGISVSSDSGGNQTDTEGSSTTERSGNGQPYAHQPPPRHYKKHQEEHQQGAQSKHGQQRYRAEPGMGALSQPGMGGGMSGSEVGTTTAKESKRDKYRRPRRRRRSYLSQRTYHYGSFYLRMGAVAFGIGSMIYSGLEFGQYFELERNTKCHNVLLALTPATRMAFIFIQMYFIFLNNEMKVYKHKLLARFGLMHMIGTNLCVWLNVLVQETKHEILTFFNPENNTLGLHTHSARQHTLPVKFSSGVTASTASLSAVTGGATQALHHEHLPASHQVHHRVERGLKGPHHIYECRRTNIMGSLVQDASPFLFPCTIEYSLICAAILYVMWKNISRVEMTRCGSSRIGKGVDCHAGGSPGGPGGSMVSSRGKVHITPKRSPHHYSVDCARAHKGLFVGILVLVLTIISLILFFVLIGRPELVGLAVFEVNMCELTLYALSTLATLAGMIRVRELRYDGGRNLELDSILLIVSQTGMFTYSTFTVIGGHFTLERNTALVLATALASLVQTTVQTIFVLDASRRSCATASQIRRKPGREVVTFLLVANLAMWAVNTLEKSRAESHPVQLHFYGLWAWTIITHVSMPLAIFYRFHSTVCLCEIWKRAYKMKPVYM